MAAVLYLLGLISIVLGAIVAADPLVETYQLGAERERGLPGDCWAVYCCL